MENTEFSIGYFRNDFRPLSSIGKNHVFMGTNDPLCGCNLIKTNRFQNVNGGDISSQECMDELSESGWLCRSVCQNCMKSLIKLGSKYNVEVKPKTWVIQNRKIK